MWLVFDIGNSALKGGLFEDASLKHTFRLNHNDSPAQWKKVLNMHLQGASLNRVGLTSVVPKTAQALQEILRAETGLTTEVIHAGMPLPFRMGYRTPETLGTDRLASAVAAWSRYGPVKGAPPAGIIALDAGTAITYDVVDGDGVFLGGPIAAGPRLIQQALKRDTAQLPVVSLELPEEPIGRTTQEAMQAGLMYGFLDSVEGMVRRIRHKMEVPPVVVATGGWSSFLAAHLHGIDHVEPHLVLHGIRLLMAGGFEEKTVRGG